MSEHILGTPKQDVPKAKATIIIELLEGNEVRAQVKCTEPISLPEVVMMCEVAKMDLHMHLKSQQMMAQMQQQRAKAPRMPHPAMSAANLRE